jgi:hypothetical protein
MTIGWPSSPRGLGGAEGHQKILDGVHQAHVYRDCYDSYCCKQRQGQSRQDSHNYLMTQDGHFHAVMSGRSMPCW